MENSLKKIISVYAEEHLNNNDTEETKKKVFAPLKTAIALPGDPTKERVIVDLLLSINNEAIATFILELFLESNIKARERIKDAILKSDDELKIILAKQGFATRNNDIHRAFLEVLSNFTSPKLLNTLIFEETIFDHLSIANRENLAKSVISEETDRNVLKGYGGFSFLKVPNFLRV